MTSQAKWTEPIKGVEPDKESRRQPVWHVIVLNVFTMFLYSLMWFYKNWSELTAYAREEIDSVPLDEQTRKALESIKTNKPLLWTALLAFPGIQMYAAARFFAKLVSIAAPPGFFKTHRWLSGILLTAAMVGLLCFAELKGAPYLLFLTAALPLAFAQSILNGFWKRVEPDGLLVRHAFTPGELFALIIGSLGLGLVVTGLFNH